MTTKIQNPRSDEEADFVSGAQGNMPVILHPARCQLVEQPVDMGQKTELFAALVATMYLNLVHQALRRHTVGVVTGKLGTRQCRRVRTRHINH